MLQKLKGYLTKPATSNNKSTAPVEHRQPSHSLWRDTGKVWYLLDTCKICYQGRHGKVTIENVNVDEFSAVLDAIRGELAALLTEVPALSEQALVSVSMCGVSWQQLSDQKRIKAIKDAAVLEISLLDQSVSRAMFQYELQTVNRLWQVTSVEQGVYRYTDIKPEQFIQQIRHHNDNVYRDTDQGISVDHRNFLPLFSDNERTHLSRIIPVLAHN